MRQSKPGASAGKKEPGRNDPCWCGSGKKYKKCHLDREFEEPPPFKAMSNAMLAAWRHKQCLHPLAASGVCDKIVSAHSVQRSRTLERIVDSSNHVHTFYPPTPDETGELRIHRIGWRQASTFTGFCAKHDNRTFAPLEVTTFTGTEEQCFLVGYRALCHEVYQKIGALRAQPVLRAMADKGLPRELQEEVQGVWSVLTAGTEAGLSAHKELKARMDRQLVDRDFFGWSRVIVHFRGDLCLLSTGAVSPNRNFSGQVLQVLHDPNPATELEILLCGLVATPLGGAVVLTWAGEHNAPRRFVESILGQSRLGSILVQFMFAHIENTYFSGAWWHSLSAADRSHLAALAAISNPYYTDFAYSSSEFVPWEIADILVEHCR